MRKKIFLKMTTPKGLFLLCFLLSFQKAQAYDASKVHPKINESSARQSQLFLGWLNDSGFEGEKDELDRLIHGKSVKEWFEQGGLNEDESSRFMHHFHDPTKSAPWSDAGLDQGVLYVIPSYSPPYNSSLIWSQGGDGDYENRFSWGAARESFYQALTTGNEEN